MQPFDPSGAPVVSTSGGRTPVVVAAIVVAVFAVAGIVVALVVAGGDDADDADASSSASGVVAAESALDRPGGLDPAEVVNPPRSTTTPTTTATPSSTALGEPSERPSTPAGNLILDGASPALGEVAARLGLGAELSELVLYDTYAITTYRNPDAPGDLDRVVWRDGALGEPEAVGFADDETDGFFTLEEVATDQVPSLAQQALDGFALEGGEVTHVIVDRFFGLDDGGVAIRVYVSHPERGGGGYLLARGDGTVVRLVG